MQNEEKFRPQYQNEEECINDALQMTFPAGILLAILQRLNLNEVMSLYLTCNYFYDMDVMRSEINKRLEHDGCHAFCVAVNDSDINVVKNFCEFARGDSELINKLLTTGVPNAFELSITIDRLDIFKLIVNLIGNDDALKYKLLTTDGRELSNRARLSFCQAAAKGHVEMLKLLWALSNGFDDIKEAFLTKDNSFFYPYRHVFSASVAVGADVLKLLWKFAAETNGLREKWFDKHSYNMFAYASEHNKTDVIKQLLLFSQEFDALKRGGVVAVFFKCAIINLSYEAVKAIINFVGDDDALKQELLMFDKCHPFRFVIQEGQVDILKLLCEFVGGDKGLKREVLKFYNFGALNLAVSVGYVNILKVLCAFVGDDEELKRVLLTSDNCAVMDCWGFARAASKGCVDALQVLWEFAGNDDGLKRRLLNSSAFCWAAEAGNVEVLKLLWWLADSHEGSRRELLMNNINWRICLADESYDLVKLNEEEKSGFMLKFNDGRRYLRRQTLSFDSDRCLAFRQAAKIGCGEVLKLLWAFANSHEGVRQKLLMSNNCQAFCWAAEEGHIGVSKLLWKFVYDEKLEDVEEFRKCFLAKPAASHSDVRTQLKNFQHELASQEDENKCIKKNVGFGCG